LFRSEFLYEYYFTGHVNSHVRLELESNDAGLNAIWYDTEALTTLRAERDDDKVLGIDNVADVLQYSLS